jgi:hypothetical protein
MSEGPSLLWGRVATARVPHTPTVAMGEGRPLLLGHHNSDGMFVYCYRGLRAIGTEAYYSNVGSSPHPLVRYKASYLADSASYPFHPTYFRECHATHVISPIIWHQI